MRRNAIIVPSSNEKSVFTASDFIRFKGVKKNRINFSFPRICIMGFFPSISAHIRKSYNPFLLDSIHRNHPYYIFHRKNRFLSFQLLGIGAPAAGLLLEESIALGAETILFFGPAGVLDERIPFGSLMIPEAAIRDEGTSAHYAAHGRIAYPDPQLLRHVKSFLHSSRLCFHEGKTWSTDAPYRETPRKITDMIGEGCISVDMEASALFAISKHYQKKIVGIFLATDVVTEKKWIPRKASNSKMSHHPIQLFEIAADIFNAMPEETDAKQ